MASQPANAPADSASIAGAAGSGAQAAADPTAAAGEEAASAFHDALADACGDAAKSQSKEKGAAKRKGAACDGAAASAPTFPAWRLVIALEAQRVGDAKSGKGHQKPRSEAEGDLGSDGNAAAGAADGAVAQGIAVVPDVPVVPALQNAVPPTGANGADVQGGAAPGGEAATAVNAAEASAQGPSATANENANDTAPSDGAQRISAGSAPPQSATAESASVQRATAQSATAQGVGIQDDDNASEPAATSAATAGSTASAAPALTDTTTADSNRSNQTSSGKPAAAHGMPSQTGTAFTSANGSAPSQAPAAASTQAALTSDTDDAAAKLATTASTVTAIPTEKTDAGESSQDRITEAMAPGKSVESAAPSAMGHSGGNRDATPQHGEPEARGHNASPEPLMTSRAVAFATAMTLVSSPDGTLRITSLPSAPPTLASLLPEESRANLDSMVQTMRVMVRDTVSEATLHLRPEHFGEVTIQVRVDGKSVSAIINTESPGVREWLQAQESTIRNGLSEHGLHLERLLVQRDGRHERRQQAPQQQGAKRRRTRDDADAQQTFEISV